MLGSDQRVGFLCNLSWAPCGGKESGVPWGGREAMEGRGSGLTCILVDLMHRPQAQVIPEGLLPDPSCEQPPFSLVFPNLDS